MENITDNLWAKSQHEEDTDVILEQYKIYIASAENISQRRHSANTFFLSFNTALIGALAGFFDEISNTVILNVFYIAAITLCITWALLLRSYRNLNTAKFMVIGALEKKLPSSPFWGAEWTALGFGKNYRKYIPLSVLETLAPAVFLVTYLYLLIGN